MRRMLTLLTLLSAFWVAGCATVPQTPRGVPKWKVTPGNIEMIKAQAQSGDVYAQVLLGEALVNGICMKDKDEGHRLFRQALVQDPKNPIALYYTGITTEYDLEDKAKAEIYYAQALRGIKKLAAKGDARAQRILGEMYLLARAVEKNQELADLWTDKAVEQGFCIAQFTRGVYTQGKDLPAAMELFEKAAHQRYIDAMRQLSGFHYDGYIGDKTGSTIDYEKCFYWSLKGAEHGESWGYIRLGNLYGEGKGVPKDIAREARLLYQGQRAGARDSLSQSRLDAIDRTQGLLLPVKVKWSNSKDVLISPALDRKMTRFIEGYEVGMGDTSRALFTEVLKTDPSYIYRNDYWYRIYISSLKGGVGPSETPMPLSVLSEILMAVYPQEKDTFTFWFDYANSATLAGHPELTLKAVKGMKAVIRKTGQQKNDLQNPIAAVLEANALVALGRDKEAYALLYESDKIDAYGDFLVNYINCHATFLLKDKKKLAFVTEVPLKKWVGHYPIDPTLRRGSFHDVETGRLVVAANPRPVAAVTPSAPVAARPKPAPAGNTNASLPETASGQIIKEYYDNGKLKAEITYKGGKKNGAYKQYHTLGYLEETGSYRDDKKDGPYTRYMSGGQVLLKATYKAGILHGSYIQYYSRFPELNMIRDKGVFVNGKFTGVRRWYQHKSKHPNKESYYKDDKLHGVQKFYYGENRLHLETTYNMGLRDGVEKEYNTDGTLKSEKFFKDDKEM